MIRMKFSYYPNGDKYEVESEDIELEPNLQSINDHLRTFALRHNNPDGLFPIFDINGIEGWEYSSVKNLKNHYDAIMEMCTKGRGYKDKVSVSSCEEIPELKLIEKIIKSSKNLRTKEFDPFAGI